MNKRGLERETIILLVISIIVLIGISGYVIVFTDLAKGSANKQAVQTWVRLKGLETKAVGTFAESSRPPVPYLDEPLEVESEDLLFSEEGEYPEVNEELADSMYDCWEVFERSNIDFIQGISKKTFCYPCRIIKFSDTIKSEGIQIKGFKNYLNSNKQFSGTNNPTYLQFLSNNPELEMTEEELEGDILETDKDLYVMFYAASGRAWKDMALLLLGAEETSEKARSMIPMVETEGDTEGLESIAAGTAAETATLGRKKIAEGTGKLAIKLGDIAAGTATTEAIEEIPGQGKFLIQKKISKKAASSLVGKTVAKSLGAVAGVKLIPYIGWAYTLYELGSGGIKIVWEEKPFVATVMLADAEKILPLCNQEIQQTAQTIEESKRTKERIERIVDVGR